MKQVLKCFNVVTMITLLLSIILPSPSAFATEINKKSWDELQGNDVKIKAEQVNAEMYKGEVAEREHVFQYKIENTGDTPIRELVIKQNNDNGIEFLSQSVKVNGEKLLENKVADFYVEEKDNGGKVLSSNLKIQDLKSHEKMTVLIKARRAQHFNKEYKQKISVQKDQLQIGNMSVDVEGLPSEEKLEANTDDEADSSKKAIGSTTDSKTKEVDGKLKVSVEDKNTSTQKTEIEKVKQPEAEKQLEKEEKQSPLAVKQSDAEVQAASENASKVQIQTGDKQGFGDPLYSTIAPGNLVQTGNVTLGLTDNHYTRQSVGGKTNKKAVDVDNDDTTFNSSTGAFPNIPAGSKVKKAYLFWTAAMGTPSDARTDYRVSDEDVRQPVKMKMGNKQYAEVSADSIRKADSLPYIANHYGSGAGYVAYADVTNVIAQQGISQTVTVANVPQIKFEKGSGYYWGNWNLILVYENYKETVKDMKIWEGLVSQKSTAWTDINVNKINTPKEGAFKAKFSYFSSQGDPADNDGYAYDYGEYDFGLGYQKFKNIKGKDNDVNDSSMTEVQVDGTNEFVTKKYPGYNPDWTNSFSTDIHTYHLEGPNQVKNDLKEAKMRFRAYGGGGDIYVLNNATFVTEHNAPNLQVDKKALDSAGKEIKDVKAGEEFTYQIEVKNDTKNNQAPVSNVKGFDKLDDRLEYVPGSIQYVSGSNKGNKTDNASDDEAEFVNNQIDFRVGEGADAKNGGVLKPGESTVITFKVKVKDSVQSDTTVKNVVVVKGQDSAEIKYETEDDANVTVTTQKEVPGEIEARKIASNKTPKLGEEVEYRITFKNKTKDVLTIEDELPSSLEYVKDSLKAEGAKPEPVELKFENGKVIAKYPEIMDMEERSIVFKTKVKETAKIGEEIVNKATVRDKTNPPKNLEEKITPQHKAGKIAAKKKATNKKPRLGEEVEYQISFKNTVENGKLDAVTIEDEIPANLEFVQGSVRAEGAAPNPVELKVENGKIIAKYPEITDTKERSIAFKVKVKEEAKAGETIVNKAVVSEPNGQTEHPEEKITPDYKYGKVDVEKSVTNQTPKLGEEVEYRITFYNTVENGKLEKVLVEDTLPKGVEYVKNSLKAEGIKPEPVELKVEDGKVMAKYPEITDTEKRSIVFKVKVKDSAKVGEAIVNKAIAKDPKNEPVESKVVITPQSKKGEIAATKVVNNKKPKLGEEIEYRISFHNTVENGKLEEVRVEDTIPKGLEYVENSIKAEGEAPEPVELAVENGIVKAKYIDIMDMKERSIVFKVKVKEEVKVDKEIVNKAIVDDTKNPPIEPEERITPQHKDGIIDSKKTVDNSSPKLGEEVEYRISMKNTVKNGKLTDVTVEDTLPEGLEYVENSLKAEGAGIDSVELKFENGKVMAKYPEITDTEERSIVFKVKVKEEVKVGKKIINKATIDDSQNKPVNPTAEITPQYKDGKLEAKKIVNNETPKLGEEVEYRISFKNTVEHGKLTEVKIEDDLPNGLEYVKDSLKVEGSKPDPVELKFENGKVMAKYPEITDTKERSITFKVKVKGKVSDSIVNEAIVSDTKHPPETPTAEIIPQHKDGKVKAKKTVNNETPKLGEEVEYRISFKNTVEDGKLAEVKIEDTLPEGLEYVENSVKAEGTKPDPVELKMENGKVMAKYPEITDTEERSITFKVKVKEEVKVGKKIVNKAIVDDTKNEPETPTAEITPQHKDGKVEAKKTVNNETPKLGEEVEYRISFKNTVENGKLAEVKIEDNLPNGLEYVKDSLRAEGTKPDPVELKVKDGKVIAKYPEITDTEERSIVFKAKVKEEFKVGEGLVNKVVVDDTKDPTTSEVTITPEYKDGKLKAEKFVNNKKPKLGEEVEYRISFKNTVENGKLVEVTVEDEIPAGLEYVENSLQAEGSKPSPVELKFENGKVMAKYLEITDTKERSIIFKVRVKEEAEVGKEIVNKAIVVDTKNEPEEPHVEITPQYKDGKIAAQKVANNHKPKLGEEVEYRISFKNTVENGKLAEVNIKDALPNGLEYVEGSITAEGSKPKPVELHVKNNKVMAKYPEITDTEERSIVFKAKVKESVKVGEEIVNEAIVDDTKNLPEEPYVPITPQYKDGKIEARKEVSNHEPKLGEEIEYRIIFNNTVKDGKLAEVKIEDKIPAGLEFVEGSEKAEGEEPKPVELKVENGKVMAKYSEIMDTQERSIVFKVKVKDSVTIGKDITNKAIIHVDDPNHPVIDPTAKITPQYKDGKIAAHKKVNNHKPKLGEEIEYRISFNNTVKDGKLAEVKIEDEIPFGLEYVKDSLKAEGDKPAPVELKEEAGKVSAKYENITDMKERSILFKVKVKDSVEVDKAIVNKAIVDDTKNPPERPEVDITPQHKDGKFKANKKVSKKDPKLGEEVEYRISFKNTVENGKLAEVKIEDQLPNGLEYVKDSLKAEGNEPNPVELKEEAGKITAKYENITDTAERSIIFKVKVTEAVKVGKKIVNTAIVDDDNPKNPPQKPEAIITPEYKNGKIKAEKTVNNPAPKLGEEVEYRITFRNVVEHGKLAKVKIKDELPNSLEFVEGSERAEGDNPKPLHVKVKNGIVLAEYPEITDTKERSIVFKAKVKEKAKIGEAIVNTAVVEDTINPPEKPNVAIQPQHKEGVLQAEKTVSNHEPKLGEEVEYRISFENTVENGKLTEVKVEDEIPAGLEYVQDSIKSDGPEPNPVELKVENGKVTAKYPEITDTKKRSIIFKVKVQETVQVGKEIINKAVVDDNNPTNPPVESLIPITPQYKDGKLEARKEVSNHEPKLGEEIEYRITFNGTVDGGKLVDVKIEDEIPSGLEYVKESLEAVGDKPVPTELKVENGKVTVKYPEIMDTKERSIIFKVKVKESVKVGEEITNKAIIHVDDPDHPVMEPTATIKPEYKDGKLKATKTVNNKEPKLGEEVEYRINFKNTVENGKLAEVKVEDGIPAGLEYVQDSIRFEGAEPNPIELKMEFGKVIAKYLEITDTKERSIIFKVKVKAAPSKGITNRAVVDDKINPPLEPTVTILPKTKEDLKIPEEPKEPEVKPEEPKEPKEPEVKPEEPKEPEVKPEEPKEPKEPEVKPEDPKEPKEPEVKPEEPKEPKEPKEPEVKPEEPKEPEVKPEEPKEPKEPEVKPEEPKEPKEPEVKPEEPKEPKEPEVKPEDPKEPKEPEVKPEEPKEPKEPEVKPEDPKEPKEPEVKPEEPKEPEVKPEEPKEPEVKPEEPKEPKEPEVKPEEPKDLKKPEVKPEKPEIRLEKLIKEPQVKVEKELPKTGAAHSWMMSVGAGISFLVGGVLFVLGRRRKQ
ncbi:isopeptide-forming domain-containing fimbrial protein [Bacillus cereus group sp. MYBK65-1]|uniref:isopeptide-forming domain-containing fimbrial protein n=1 Tax=Bacillus cereus group sp. MYBK65-1 TaxID=3450615 RepID=UPI002A4FA227|nr:isopeptide-forming domain-containing fimbrial protein [Bacillus cereus]